MPAGRPQAGRRRDAGWTQATRGPDAGETQLRALTDAGETQFARVLDAVFDKLFLGSTVGLKNSEHGPSPEDIINGGRGVVNRFESSI